MVNSPLALLLSLAVGVVLGAVFFGGLWWTVQKGVSARRPALWFLGSLLIRAGVVLGGFYVVGGKHWERLLSCLLGFVIARFVVTWMTRPMAKTVQQAEASHAP